MGSKTSASLGDEKSMGTLEDPDDQRALQDIFSVRNAIRDSGLLVLFRWPGGKRYDHASGQKFAMQEFRLANRPSRRRSGLSGIQAAVYG